MSKKILIALIALFSVVLIVIGSAIVYVLNEPQQATPKKNEVAETDESALEVPEESTDEPIEKQEEVVQEEPQQELEQEKSEESSTWDDFKEKDKIVGKSDKDFASVVKDKPTNVRNDKTGKWRKTSIAESIDIEEYALSYYNTYMNDGEVHYIINFTRNTTTWLNNMGGLLYVDIKEHVKKEEHDASTLGSGTTLKSYVIYPDGDIQELDVN